MVLVQIPLQSVSVPGHAAWQTPPTHGLPPQSMPQAPQFAPSFTTFTQLPAQSVWPGGHIDAQTPCEQTCPG
jgi:hypothetical protein